MSKTPKELFSDNSIRNVFFNTTKLITDEKDSGVGQTRIYASWVTREEPVLADVFFGKNSLILAIHQTENLENLIGNDLDPFGLFQPLTARSQGKEKLIGLVLPVKADAQESGFSVGNPRSVQIAIEEFLEENEGAWEFITEGEYLRETFPIAGRACLIDQKESDALLSGRTGRPNEMKAG